MGSPGHVPAILVLDMAGDLSKQRRVLLVATDLLLQSRVVEGVRALGYDVDVAATAPAARAALRSSPPALLVLDLQAADIAWPDVLAAAKDSGVPVLAYGQHTKPDILRAARRAGCDMAVARSTLVKKLPRLIERIALAAPPGRADL